MFSLRLAAVALTGLALASFVACNPYDETLLGSGGSSSSGSPTGSTTTGGEGGEAPCSGPDQCPGTDTECGAKTCEGGFCGVAAQPLGTPLAQQQGGDCQRAVCDGNGGTDSEPDDGDLPNDNNDCTTDTCSNGSTSFANKTVGATCSGGVGAKVCSAAGVCVECVVGSDCASGICTQQNTCSPASCGDLQQNGAETDIDCGGPSCPGCAQGEMCAQGSDCVSGSCAGTCQPSCSDGVQNQDETGVDCGGGACAPCAVGLGCDIGADCVSAVCTGNSCGEYRILISEFRARGPMGGSDDFVELYNPLTSAVTLPLSGAVDKFEVISRSDAAANYGVKWTGNGETIPARGHILLVGSAYSGAVAGDSLLGTGLTDKVSLVIRRGATTLDAACLYCGTSPFDAGYICEGTPVNVTGCSGTSWGDKSLERLPGGAAGNNLDSNDTTADFQLLTNALPQNLMSAPTP